MSLDLDFDDGQRAIASAVSGFCEDRCSDETVRALSGTFPRELWRGLWSELAELGVLALATPHGEGGALEVVAAVEPLGRAVFPGPLAASFLATQLLPDPERAQIAEGARIVSAGAPPLWPWGPCADLLLEIEGDAVHRCHVAGEVEPVPMLGGEPWGRVHVERGELLSQGDRGVLLSRIVLAAQLASMATRLVEDASAHAAVRKQFGTAIGDFQAVAHPLADCSMRLAGATALARSAAFQLDAAGVAAARVDAAAAQLCAAAAAVEAAHACHQVFGAIGITLEGPAFHVSRRIRQLASQAPTRETARAALVDEFALTGRLRGAAAGPLSGDGGMTR